MKMAHVDGWAVLRTLSGVRPQVIVHSAQEFGPRDIREFFEVRPFGVLPKPVRPSRMLAAVEEAVDQLSAADG
jgi:DNA-binding NarL/FixJ family response regulator